MENKNYFSEILCLIKKKYENGSDNFLCNCYMDYVNNYISIDTMFDYELFPLLLRHWSMTECLVTLKN